MRVPHAPVVKSLRPLKLKKAGETRQFKREVVRFQGLQLRVPARTVKKESGKTQAKTVDYPTEN